MAVLTARTAGLAPSAFTEEAVSAADSFANDGRTLLKIIGPSSASVTVVADSPTACNFGATAAPVHDTSFVVPTGQSMVCGPFPPERYNDTNGRVQLTATGTLTAAKYSVIKF